jgi:hypothetical protein
MFAYYAARVFRRLDAFGDLPTDELVSLEWTYFEALEHSERPARNLDEALATDPKFFMMLMKAMYLPSDGVSDSVDGLTEEQAESIASHAFSVLSHWRRVPGSDASGAIDGAKLQAWVLDVRRLASEARRSDIVDVKIGEILSAARRVDGQAWPPEPVRDVIDNLRSRPLESGFVTGLYNRRGVTMRMPTDGGEQERDLAAKYRLDAKAVALSWPRTSAVLDRIAASYDQDAAREDLSAEVNDW